MRFFRFLVGWWGAGRKIAPVSAPPERTFLVEFEARSCLVLESRLFVVDLEGRSFVA